MKSTGMKTAASDTVMEMIVNEISRDPSNDACMGVFPISMWRMMFSSITIASSTTKPTESVSAISERLSRLYPSWYITANVATIEAGSARLGMIVAETFLRKMKITATTRPTVSSSVSLTSATDSRIATERSLNTSNEMVGGQLGAERRQKRLDRVDHGHDVRARLLLNPQINRALALEPADRLVVLDAVVHMSDFVEQYGIAVPVGDDRRRVFGGAQQLTICLHRVRAFGRVEGPCRQVDVRRLNGGRDFVDADPSRGEPARIEIDPDGVLGLPEDRHLRHAADGRDPLRNRGFGVLVDLRNRQHVRSDDEEHHGLVARIDLLIRRRRRHLRRQLALSLRDHRLDILRGGIDVPAQSRTES